MTLSSIPLVSIVVCTYNGSEYIREQLNSLLIQSFPIYEIIVQDDCSSDDTWSILESYRERYPTLFKIYRNDNNLFWNQNFYSAILKCSGDYIALCDQDDIWEPNKIEIQVKELLESSNLIHICGQWLWEDENITPLSYKASSILHSFFYPPFCGHTMMFSSSIKKHIASGQRIDMAHDMFIGLIGSYLESITYSDSLLVKWRRHPKSSTGHFSPVVASSGMKKVFYSLGHLNPRKRSSMVFQAVTKYYEELCYLAKEFGIRENTVELIHFFNNLRQQSVLSYIKATVFLCGNDDIIIGNRFSGIKKIYNKITYLFRWWYDHQNEL